MIPTEHYLRGSFRSAVSGDNQAIFHTLLRAGADVDEVCNGGTALEAAIENKNYDTVLWLLDLEARPNTQTKSYQEVGNDNQGKYCKAYHKLYGNPLVMAIFWGRSDVVERLCKAGANLNALGCHVLRPGEYACRCILPVTAALKVKNYTLFHSLIGMGAAINNPPGSSPDSATPIEVIIKSHSLGDVHAFLQIGANPYDYEAVKYARDHPEVFQVLLESMRNWSAHLSSTELGDAALITVARLCNKETVSILLDSSLENTISTHGLSLALLEALTSEGTAGLEIVTILLRHGADPNSVYGPDGDCPQSAVCLSINKSSLEYLDLLLKAGAKENASLASVSRCLPLQTGVINGNQDIVCKLLKEGWNPDAFAGIRGYSYLGTPLQIAVGKQVYNTEIIKLLLRHKCNVEATCEDNPHTALQIASRDGKKEIVELLYQYGANVNAPAAEEYGATALQFAAIQGYLGIATLLIDYEADVNAPAAEFDGRTALEGAAEHGRIDMVQLLLNAGATIVQEGDTQYQNAMRRASQNGHLAIRRLLEAARPMDEPESVVDLADADVMNWTSGEQPATDSTNQSDSGANLIDELQFDALEQTVGEPYFTDQPPLIDMDQGEWDWNGIYDL
jgi:ankyrin repeat protein